MSASSKTLGNIKGDSKRQGQIGKIELSGYKFESKFVSGKKLLLPIEITKKIDQSSYQLLQACSEKALLEIVILVTQFNYEQRAIEVVELTLKNARIVSFMQLYNAKTMVLDEEIKIMSDNYNLIYLPSKTQTSDQQISPNN